MPFIGQQPLLGTYRLLDSITTSATTTFALTVDGVAYTPASAQNLIVSLNGVTQAPQTAYTIQDSNIVFATALTTSDVIDYIMALGDVLDVGTISDGTVTNAKLQNGAVTASKMTIDGHLIPTANVTYDLGTNDLRFRDIYLSGSTIKLGDHSIAANGTHITMVGMAFGATAIANNFTIQNDLTVGGDFVVNGNTTTIAASELKVEDSLIQLASNNEISDTVDIGFVGHYYNGSSQLHTGFFRDATDGQYYLFTGYDDASFDTNTPPATIDRTANTFALADLNTGKINATVDSNIAAAFSSTTTTAKITLADANDQAFIDINASRIGIGHSSSTSLQALQIEPTSAEAMRIDSNGNVGIGETDPTGIIHTKSDDLGVVLQTSSTVNKRMQIFFWDSAGTTTGRIGNDISAANTSSLDFISGTGTTPHMRIDSSGNVGIGTISPSYPLDVVGPMRINHVGSDTFATIRGPGNRDLRIDIDANGDTDSFIVRDLRDGSERFTVQAGGDVGIGTSTFNLSTFSDPAVAVGSAASGTRGTIEIASNIITNTAYGILAFTNDSSTDTTNNKRVAQINATRNGNNNASDLDFITNSGSSYDTRMKITAAGNVGINITNPNYPLDVSPSSPALGTTINNSIGLAEFYHTNGNASYLRVTGVRTSSGTAWTSAGTRIQQVIDSTNQAFMEFNGLAGDYQWGVACGSNPTTLDLTLTTGGNLSITGTFTESSALRYKENVRDLEYNNIISQLKPKIYNKIGQEKQEVGLIAEEVEALDKTLVTYNDDGQVEGIQYTRLVPHLIAHIQKLEERLSAIENG